MGVFYQGPLFYFFLIICQRFIIIGAFWYHGPYNSSNIRYKSQLQLWMNKSLQNYHSNHSSGNMAHSSSKLKWYLFWKHIQICWDLISAVASPWPLNRIFPQICNPKSVSFCFGFQIACTFFILNSKTGIVVEYLKCDLVTNW